MPDPPRSEIGAPLKRNAGADEKPLPDAGLILHAAWREGSTSAIRSPAQIDLAIKTTLSYIFVNSVSLNPQLFTYIGDDKWL